MTRRIAFLVWAVVAIAATTAPPAFADPARPTNFESVVDRIEPAVDGVSVLVTGGDSFLVVAAEPGTSVLVPGYSGEPYVRIDDDGVVSVNRNSPAYWLNGDRYGQSMVPPAATPDAEPDWLQVAEGGEWAWHDHRIHWMSPDLPGWAGSGEGSPWSMPIEVDGNPVVVHGTMRWHPARTPLPWVAVLAAACALAIIVGRREPLWLGALVTIIGSLAFLASLSRDLAMPPGAGSDLLALAVTAAAIAGGVVTMALGSRFRAVGETPALLGAVLLLVWALRRVSTLWLPVLPTPLPPAAERLILATILGVAAGTVLGAVARRLTAIGRSV